MINIKDLERLEKKQEKIVEKKKAYTKRAEEKGDEKSIEKAKKEEAEAIAVLEKIRENEKIVRYVKLNQPAEIAEIAKALNLPPEAIEKRIEELGLVKDGEGKIFSDRARMAGIKVEQEVKQRKIKLEEGKKKRPVVIKQWSEIAEKNPGLTEEELKEIYIRHFPEDTAIEIYLEEREREKAEIEERESPYLKGIHDILLVFLIIGLIVIVVSCLGTCI